VKEMRIKEFTINGKTFYRKVSSIRAYVALKRLEEQQQSPKPYKYTQHAQIYNKNV
jgi:hypothetical protein